MAGNPLVDQGTLNRLRASVLITASPELNVTASFLGKEMVGLTLEGEATTAIPNAAGVTQSPEPYQMATVEIHLIKAQALADQWKQRMQANTLLGDITVIPDAKTLGNYPLQNCSVTSVAPMRFSGADAGWVISLRGTYYINNDLWNL